MSLARFGRGWWLALLMVVLASCDAPKRRDDQAAVAPTGAATTAASALPAAPVEQMLTPAATPEPAPSATATQSPTETVSPTASATPGAPGGGSGAGAVRPTATVVVPAAEGIRTLLGALAEALRAGDRDAVSRLTVEDGGAGRARLLEAAAHQGWPVAGVTVELGADAPQFRGDRADTVGVQVWTRLDGMGDADRLRSEATASFRLNGGRWLVSDWRWREEPEWVRLPARPLTSAHFLMMTPDSVAEADARGALSELEAAYNDLRSTLPVTLFRPRYLVVYAPDSAVFARLVGTVPETTLGVATSQYTARVVNGEVAGLEVYGIRIVLNAAAVGQFQPGDPLFSREATLRHELVHAVLAPWTRAWTPGWLAEGTAMLYAGQPLWTRLLTANDDLGLAAFVTATSFRNANDPTGELTGRDYERASALATFVLDWWGGQALLDLYRAYADAPLAAVSLRTPALATPAQNAAAYDAVAADLTPGILARVVGVTSIASFIATFDVWMAEQQGR